MAAQPKPKVASVPFSEARWEGTEHSFIAAAIESRELGGGGAFARRCEKEISRLLDGAHVSLTHSATAALELAALLLNVGAGDEVIVPSFAFSSTANAFAMRGAKIVFADIDSTTCNIDPVDVARKMTGRTKAVVAVHYAGIAAPLEHLGEITSAEGIALIEDNALGFLGRFCDAPLGTIGDMGVMSFHHTKGISCGEGGALTVKNVRFLERLETLRRKGTNRSRFDAGKVEAYTWVDLGSAYLPNELTSAFLLAQLEAAPALVRGRRQAWMRYADALSGLTQFGVQLPQVPVTSEHTGQTFFLLLSSAAERASLISFLDARGVEARFHYQPLHLSEMGTRFGGFPGACPVTEHVAARLLRLPLFNHIRPDEQDLVISAVADFFGLRG